MEQSKSLKIDNYILVIAPEEAQSQYLSLEVVFTI